MRLLLDLTVHKFVDGLSFVELKHANGPSQVLLLNQCLLEAIKADIMFWNPHVRVISYRNGIQAVNSLVIFVLEEQPMRRLWN